MVNRAGHLNNNEKTEKKVFVLGLLDFLFENILEGGGAFYILLTSVYRLPNFLLSCRSQPAFVIARFLVSGGCCVVVVVTFLQRATSYIHIYIYSSFTPRRIEYV